MVYITNREVIQSIVAIVEYLVAGDYIGLVSSGYLDDVYEGNTEGIQETLETYPGNISMPPIDTFKEIEMLDFPKDEDDKESYVAEPYLYYSRQVSDLRLKLFCKKKQNGSVVVILYDILA